MNRLNNEIVLFFGVFSFLFMLSFSFPFQFFPDLGAYLEPLFNTLVQFQGSAFGIAIDPFHSGEDSLGMLFNAVNVLALSLVVYLLLSRIAAGDKRAQFVQYSSVFLRYYLGLMFLIYGFDKVYKWQFYAPESNIMYTRVKDLPQDMLYWTTMGTSYSYSVFGGVLEVLAGGLLFFRKTFLIGTLLGGAVMANVFAVNIGFDITVKLFSGFLLMICFVLTLPHMMRLFEFLIGREVKLEIKKPVYSEWSFYMPIKIIILFLILIESQYKYLENWNFNDDIAPRPHFNGAYEIIEANGLGVERVHFHRHGYIIFEIDDEFLDYRLSVDSSFSNFLMLDYDSSEYVLHYKESGDTLWLEDSEGRFSLITVKANQ